MSRVVEYVCMCVFVRVHAHQWGVLLYCVSGLVWSAGAVCAQKRERVCVQAKSVISTSAELRQRPCCVTVSLSATGASVVWGQVAGFKCLCCWQVVIPQLFQSLQHWKEYNLFSQALKNSFLYTVYVKVYLCWNFIVFFSVLLLYLWGVTLLLVCHRLNLTLSEMASLLFAPFISHFHLFNVITQSSM